MNSRGKSSRRDFLQATAAAAVAAAAPATPLVIKNETLPRGGFPTAAPSPKPMRLGLIVGMGKDPEAAIKKVHDLGVPTCQVGVESYGPEMVSRLRSALDHYSIEATSVVVGFPGPRFTTSTKVRRPSASFRASIGRRELKPPRRLQTSPSSVGSRPSRDIAVSSRRTPTILSTTRWWRPSAKWPVTRSRTAKASATKRGRRRPSPCCAPSWTWASTTRG